jgi:hypothetical protein
MPKPTIVLVHGAWADSSSWNAVASELQSEGYTVRPRPERAGATITDVAGSHVSMVSNPKVTIDAILAAGAAVGD